MAKVRLQYRNDGFVGVNVFSGMIQITAPTWRAKRWGVKQVKRLAKANGATLRKADGVFYVSCSNMRAFEYQFSEALKRCWKSPNSRDMRSVNRRTCLDISF